MLILVLPACGCWNTATPPGPAGPPTGSTAPVHPAAELFEDVTGRMGLHFVHSQSRDGRVDYLPQTLGPGVASLDYDGDGFEDLYYVQGTGSDGGTGEGPVPPPPPGRTCTGTGLAGNGSTRSVPGRGRTSPPGGRACSPSTMTMTDTPIWWSRPTGSR